MFCKGAERLNNLKGVLCPEMLFFFISPVFIGNGIPIEASTAVYGSFFLFMEIERLILEFNKTL